MHSDGQSQKHIDSTLSSYSLYLHRKIKALFTDRVCSRLLKRSDELVAVGMVTLPLCDIHREYRTHAVVRSANVYNIFRVINPLLICLRSPASNCSKTRASRRQSFSLSFSLRSLHIFPMIHRSFND